MVNHKIAIFGFGYCAQYFANSLLQNQIEVVGTSRQPSIRAQWAEQGVQLYDFDAQYADALLDGVTGIVVTIAPTEQYHDRVWDTFADKIIEYQKNLNWCAYLSTTGVYGDHQGAWVDERAPFHHPGERGQRRIEAEKIWFRAYQEHHLPVHIFRLAGIYGPGRSALDRIQAGKTDTIVKKGQYFSRVHVQDIARALLASYQQPTPGEVFNLADDMPAPSYEVDDCAAQLLNLPPLNKVPYDKHKLSLMGQEFFESNRLISNQKIKERLNFSFAYPNFKEGLEAIIKKMPS